jgi:hypothetical protein
VRVDLQLLEDQLDEPLRRTTAERISASVAPFEHRIEQVSVRYSQVREGMIEVLVILMIRQGRRLAVRGAGRSYGVALSDACLAVVNQLRSRWGRVLDQQHSTS